MNVSIYVLPAQLSKPEPKSTTYSSISCRLGGQHGKGNYAVNKKTVEGYLRFLLDLVYHGDFRVPALVHLVDVARDELSNAQVGVVGEVQIRPVGL